MARIARVVVPGYPHHVTQRGSRRQPTFFCEEDYQLYLNVVAESCRRHGVEVWAYCLMPNHIHMIAMPSASEALSKALGFAHRKYAMRVNAREGWTGHLWQERFSSFVMDESYLLAAVRYVELNPVRAGLVDHPQDYRWSSVKSHLNNTDDVLVKVAPMLERVTCWSSFLEVERSVVEIKSHTNTGRPLGHNDFVSGLEKIVKRPMRPQKAGRKKLIR